MIIIHNEKMITYIHIYLKNNVVPNKRHDITCKWNKNFSKHCFKNLFYNRMIYDNYVWNNISANACHLTLRYEPQLTSFIIDFLKGLSPLAILKKNVLYCICWSISIWEKFPKNFKSIRIKVTDIKATKSLMNRSSWIFVGLFNTYKCSP